MTLLVDDACELATAAGPVQILGMDFVWRGRKEHLARVCAEHPRVADHLRIVLLHDPGAFHHLPEGEADLALSGHTHGGQVGLLSLGLNWTMMRLFVKAPDHGFWARGNDRLYVHRGTGHYGFPLRLGVPVEQSLLFVHAAMLRAPAPLDSGASYAAQATCDSCSVTRSAAKRSEPGPSSPRRCARPCARTRRVTGIRWWVLIRKCGLVVQVPEIEFLQNRGQGL